MASLVLQNGSYTKTLSFSGSANETVDLTGWGVNSASANGYLKLANGIIIQWGRISAGTYSATFPIAFPNLCFIVDITSFYSNDDNAKNLSSFSNTSFNTTTNYSMAMHWLAIGY